MCGIAGIFHYGGNAAPPEEATGLAMLQAIEHRGPDDGGLLVTTHALIGHRRLSVIDLSSDGHQPMSNEDETVWIAFNGEVYNFPDLRADLESAGHRFRSQTDTEVILRGYLEWGRDVVDRLNGMFAFAILDVRDSAPGRLWLVRDGVGVKPLFYRNDGSTVWFGSEIKAILADRLVAREPDPEALDAFLTFGYATAPRTGFRGIRQLLPGEWLIADRGGVTSRRWYRLPYPSSAPTQSFEESVERLDAAINNAVARQQVSDVPLGALLSGGLDSTAVVRAMSSARRESRFTPETFTMGFREDSFDESPHARVVAEAFATRHHAETVNASIADLLPQIIGHADEPLADNSMIAFYRLAQFTREHVTVALSGDGADELLAGYDTYSASRAAPRYRRIPGPIRRQLIQPLINRLPDNRRKYGWPMVLKRFVDGAEQPGLRAHSSWRRVVPESLRNELLSESYLRDADVDPIGHYAAAVDDAPDWLTPLDQQMHIDLRFHLPNDMLVKVDRMSMAHALEVRVPFLDNEVIEACLAIPAAQKRKGRSGKLPLKESLRKDVPSSIVDRRKAGFLLPIEAWFAGPWQPLTQEFLTESFAESTQWLQWKTLKRLLAEQSSGQRDHSYALFALLVLAMWWDRWFIRPCTSKSDTTSSTSPVIVKHLQR